MRRKTWAVYVITRHGIGIAARLAPALSDADVLVSERLLAEAHARAELAAALPLPLPLGPVLADTFAHYDCHLFVISVGAVVRLIAPLLRDKKRDPAVICVDDAARFAICVLSGHVGRGNAFTERVAAAIGAEAVITTASDAIGTLTVDILGRELDWTLDDPDRNVTRACAAVVNAEPVLFVQETGEPGFWPEDRALPEGVRYRTSLEGVNASAYAMLLVVSDRDVLRERPELGDRSVIYRPKSLMLGLGCDRDTPFALVERGVFRLLADAHLSWRSVRALATIDRKKDEPALIELAQKWGCPLLTFSANELDRVPGILNPSEVVKRHVGTRGVSEPAALLAAGAAELLVPKKSYTEPGAERSMTLAVARVPFPARKEVCHG